MINRPKVIVTGASSGIGRATAVRFVSDGFDVCRNARREARLHELVKRLPAGNHLVCAGSYAESEVIARIEKEVRERWGHVDVLINCAGVAQGAHATDAPLEQWRQPFDTMVEGGVRITRMAAPLMPSGGRLTH